LPEQLAHKTQKVQLEIVSVLCLIALFTHMHIFWIAALLLALIELPDFGTSLGRIAGSVERIAGIKPDGGGKSPAESIAETEQATKQHEVRPATHESKRDEGMVALSTTLRQAKRS
jgi:hypothetical protein